MKEQLTILSNLAEAGADSNHSLIDKTLEELDLDLSPQDTDALLKATRAVLASKVDKVFP